MALAARCVAQRLPGRWPDAWKGWASLEPQLRQGPDPPAARGHWPHVPVSCEPVCVTLCECGLGAERFPPLPPHQRARCARACAEGRVGSRSGGVSEARGPASVAVPAGTSAGYGEPSESLGVSPTPARVHNGRYLFPPSIPPRPPARQEHISCDSVARQVSGTRYAWPAVATRTRRPCPTLPPWRLGQDCRASTPAPLPSCYWCACSLHAQGAADRDRGHEAMLALELAHRTREGPNQP
jgi:hypothetical protein